MTAVDAQASVGGDDAGGSSLAEDLDALEAAVARLAGLDLSLLEGPAAQVLAGRLGAAVDRLGAVRLRALPCIEADGRWALDGARSYAQWVARHLGGSVAQARRDVRLGHALRDELPATARALEAGAIGLEHARVMATSAATSERRREILATAGPCDEKFLLGHARRLGVDHFRQVVRHWAAMADPDADERGFRDAREREFFEFSRTTGGYHLAGFLTDEHGQLLTTALASVMGAPAEGETRTTAQRRAAALADLAGTVLDHGLTGAGAAVRPHLSVHVTLADLERLSESPTTGPSGDAEPLPAPFPGSVATFDDGTPVPSSLLARIACDSEVTRIVFGPSGVVLDVGRAQRTVTGQLRRAVIARDRHCTYPGCTAPPALSEVHHPHHWADGGATSLANSALLCRHHHQRVHHDGITLTWADGAWQFTDRDGRRITG